MILLEKRKNKEERALSSQPGSDKKSDYAHCSYFCLMFLAMLVHVPQEAHFAPSRFTAGAQNKEIKYGLRQHRCDKMCNSGMIFFIF